MKTTFTLSGLRCFACTRLIKLKLEKIKGVDSCLVALDGETEIFSEKKVDASEVETALTGTNYHLKD